MSSFDKWPNVRFNVWVAQAPKTYPIKTCNVLGAMFWPHPSIFHVPPCDPHPCPMTHPWCFRHFFNFTLLPCTIPGDYTCCVKGWKVTQWIFVHEEDGFTTSIMFTSCLLFGFLFIFVSINIFLQQSTCIVFISCINEFALSCCLLLFPCCLFDHFLYCSMGFLFVYFLKHFFVIIQLFLENG